MKPLISCVMLTTSGRPAFTPSAVDAFLRQTYEPRELLIVVDGLNPTTRVSSDRRMRYYEVPAELTIGDRRNAGNAAARGSIIAHWDDDDWSAPRRLEKMSRFLSPLGEANYEVVGMRGMYFMNHDDWGDVHLFSGRGDTVNLGTSLLYTREYWSANPFPGKNAGEDWALTKRAARDKRFMLLDDTGLMVARDHAGNICKRAPYVGHEWTRANYVDLPLSFRAALTGRALGLAQGGA